jgi:hypothetical protein
MPKYKVAFTLELTENVNTDDENWKQFKNKELLYFKNSTDEDIIVKLAKRYLSWNIIDDDGRGTITPESFDYKIEKIS